MPTGADGTARSGAGPGPNATEHADTQVRLSDHQTSAEKHPARRARTARPAFDSRIVAYACLLLLTSDCWTVGRLLAHGNILYGRDTLAGHDFAAFWVAGRLAAAGRAAAAYDWPTVKSLIAAWLGPTSIRYPTMFGYPPWFMLALAPLGALPYAVAAAIWLGGTLLLYLAAVRKILPGGTAVIAALAAPPVLGNLYLGEDGLLTAGLFGCGLVMLDSAPVAAGVVLGLVAYKPQFGLLLPVFLAAGGRWRVFGGAAATLAALAALAAMAFGPGVFAAYLAAIPVMGKVYLQHQGVDVGGWGQLASVYGLLRVFGLGGAASWSGHVAAVLLAAAAVAGVAVARVRADLAAATMATAAVVANPYNHSWDLAILMVPIALLVRDGLTAGSGRGERAALALAFLLPRLLPLLLGNGPQSVAVAIAGPAACATLFGVIACRLLAAPRAAPAAA